MMYSFILTYVLTLLLLFVVYPATYYVDPNGSNSNPGSQAQPWRTLQYACTQATTSGDIIHLNAGTYNETSRSNLAVGVDIEGPTVNFDYPDFSTSPTAIVNGWSGADPILYLNSASQGTNGNQEIRYVKFDGENYTSESAIYVYRRSNVVLKNCEFINFDLRGVRIAGSGAYAAPSVHATGIEVYDCKFTNCAALVGSEARGNLEVIGTRGADLYNIYANAASRGGFGIKCVGGTNNNNHNLKIHDSELYGSPTHNWGFSVELWGSYSNCEVYNNTVQGQLNFDTVGPGDSTYGLKVYNNTVYHPTKADNNGISFDRSVNQVEIYNNYVYNRYRALFFGNAQGNTMQNIRIYQNVFYAQGDNVNPDYYSHIQFAPALNGTIDDIDIWNNVFDGMDNSQDAYQGIRFMQTGTATDISIRNNTFRHFPGNCIQHYSSAGTMNRITVTHNYYYDVGGWTAWQGTSTNRTENNNTNANPSFTGSGERPTPYYTASSATANIVDAGVDVGLEYFGSAPDIGRYEYTDDIPIYYVDAANGSDSNIGTMAYPFATIEHAATEVSAGGTIIVRNGTYYDHDGDGYVAWINCAGANGDWITIQSENLHGAILDGQSNTTNYGFGLGGSASYVKIEGFSITGTSWSGIINNSGADNNIYKNNYIYDIGKRCTNTAGNITGIYTNSGAHHQTYDSNIFNDIGRYAEGESGCTNSNLYWQNHDHPLYIRGDYLNIVNNLFYNSTAGWSVQLHDGDHIYCGNNTFADVNPNQSGQFLFWEDTDDAVVENNIFYNPNDYAVSWSDATLTNVRIRHNVIFTGSGATITQGAKSGVTMSETFTFGLSSAGFNDEPSDDYSLTSASEAIDIGRVGTYAYDILGETRPQGSAWDMGAYEYAAGYVPDPTIVPTHNSFSITWNPPTGGAGVTCTCEYREDGSTTWISAANLTWGGSQYSGSITGLNPVTTYNIRLTATTSVSTVDATTTSTPPVSDGAWYVDDNASGSNNGTSWTNAWESWGDIGWSSIEAGDTIYISGGAATNTYSGNLDVQTSGINGNPVVIMCGTDAGHNGQVIMPGLRVTGYNYVTVTGVNAGVDTFNIRITGNSTHNVILTRTEGVVIEGCEIDNATSVCVEIREYIDGGNVIRYNKIHDAGFHSVRPNRPPGDENYGFSNYEHLIIEHNEIYNLGEDGIHCQAYAGGLTVRYNHVHTQLTGVARYVDGIQARGVMWLKIHNNLFRELWSPDGVNASIYVESDWATQGPNEHAHDIQIYNNVIWEHAAGGYARGISFASREATTIDRVLIANNTIVDSWAWGIQLQLFDVQSANVTDFFVFNNITLNCYQRNSGTTRNVYSISGAGNLTIGSQGDGTDIEWDHNVSAMSSSDPLRMQYNGTFYMYDSWKSTFGTDDNGNATVPSFVDYREQNMQNVTGLQLQANDQAAIDNGVDLSSFFTIDYRGSERTGTWDIGAYKYGDLEEPEPPTLKGFTGLPIWTED